MENKNKFILFLKTCFKYVFITRKRKTPLIDIFYLLTPILIQFLGLNIIYLIMFIQKLNKFNDGRVGVKSVDREKKVRKLYICRVQM